MLVDLSSHIKAVANLFDCKFKIFESTLSYYIVNSDQNKAIYFSWQMNPVVEDIIIA